MLHQMSLHKSRLILMVVVAVGCSAALASPYIVDFIALLGRNLRHPAVITDYFIALVWAFLLGVSILAWPVPYNHKKILVLLWIARCAMTLGFLLLVEYNYRVMDAMHYFHSSRGEWAAWEGVAGVGTQRITMLTWFHQQILPDAYHAAKVSFSMIGFIAVYILYRALMLFLERDDTRYLYLIGLFPSILLWSSPIGKDAVVLMGIALYAYGVIGQYRRGSFWYIALIVIGISLAAYIRPWMPLIMVAPLATFLISSFQGIFARVILTVLFVISLVFSFNLFADRFRIENTQDFGNRVNSYQASLADGGSGQNLGLDFTDTGEAIGFLPYGMFSALFRPLPGEVLNPFGLLSGLENAALLVMLALAIKRSRLRDVWNPVIRWMILYVLLWAAMYGFVSFNLGTIVRYKLQMMPFLVFLLLYLSQKRAVPVAKQGVQKSLSPIIRAQIEASSSDVRGQI